MHHQVVYQTSLHCHLLLQEMRQNLLDYLWLLNQMSKNSHLLWINNLKKKANNQVVTRHQPFRTAHLSKSSKAWIQMNRSNLSLRVLISLKTFLVLSNHIINCKNFSNNWENRLLQKQQKKKPRKLLKRLLKLLKYHLALANKNQKQSRTLRRTRILLQLKLLLHRHQSLNFHTRISLSCVKSQGQFPRPQHITQLRTS